MSGRIVIIGGGISGLSALEHITRVAPEVDVVLVESSPRLGGHIKSVVQDGFVMEGGPDVMLSAKPAAIQLAERVGLGDRLQGTNPGVKGSYILSAGRLRRVPDGLTGLVPSRFGPFATTSVISPIAKLRVALEYFIPPRRDASDESIESFVTRRLGSEMYYKLVEPLLSGISAGDGSRLSIAAMFPQLRDFESRCGGLVRGMLAAKKKSNAASKNARGNAPAQRPTVARSPFVSFPNGLEELITGVARVVGVRKALSGRIDVRTSSPVVHISKSADLLGESSNYEVLLANGHVIAADAVILATPAYASSQMVRSLDHELSNALAKIEYASTATVSLAYKSSDVPRALDATGYVIPKREGRDVLAVTWSSAKFLGRAPEHHALFRLFLGGAGRVRPDILGDDQILEIAKAELRDVTGVTAEPMIERIFRFDRGLPQYTVGHRERIAAISSAAERLRGIELAGAVYRGVGIPDCVQSGMDAASRALASVQSSRPSLTSSTV